VKIDELPQLLNVIRGEMAIVGPRPEDPEIVRRWFSADDRATLRVLPGLTSPGSLYASITGDVMLPPDETERHYAEQVLPITLALDRFYIRHASLIYDMRIVARTCGLILASLVGQQWRLSVPELREAVEDAGPASSPVASEAVVAAEPLRQREGVS
jgi:lipopolysaccharide/colanic/teichoic acid biosynthesis glycosyltransferase